MYLYTVCSTVAVSMHWFYIEEQQQKKSIGQLVHKQGHDFKRFIKLSQSTKSGLNIRL